MKKIKKLKVEMYLDVEEDSVDEIKKMTHHADYLLDLESYPEIKSVYGVTVKEFKTKSNFKNESNDIAKVYLVQMYCDDTGEAIAGYATTEEKANEMVEKLEEVFEDAFEYEVIPVEANMLFIDGEEFNF